MATMPHATGTVRHEAASGTRASTGPNWTYVSSMIVTTWTATKITAAPPRKRCRSSSQADRGRPPSTRVLSASPQSALAARSAQDTMPAARAVSQRSVLCVMT